MRDARNDARNDDRNADSLRRGHERAIEINDKRLIATYELVSELEKERSREIDRRRKIDADSRNEDAIREAYNEKISRAVYELSQKVGTAKEQFTERMDYEFQRDLRKNGRMEDAEQYKSRRAEEQKRGIGDEQSELSYRYLSVSDITERIDKQFERLSRRAENDDGRKSELEAKKDIRESVPVSSQALRTRGYTAERSEAEPDATYFVKANVDGAIREKGGQIAIAGEEHYEAACALGKEKYGERPIRIDSDNPIFHRMTLEAGLNVKGFASPEQAKIYESVKADYVHEQAKKFEAERLREREKSAEPLTPHDANERMWNNEVAKANEQIHRAESKHDEDMTPEERKEKRIADILARVGKPQIRVAQPKAEQKQEKLPQSPEVKSQLLRDIEAAGQSKHSTLKRGKPSIADDR